MLHNQGIQKYKNLFLFTILVASSNPKASPFSRLSASREHKFVEPGMQEL